MGYKLVIETFENMTDVYDFLEVINQGLEMDSHSKEKFDNKVNWKAVEIKEESNAEV